MEKIEGGLQSATGPERAHREVASEWPLREAHCLGADFWEVDLDSNFSVLGVRRFTEWPGPLHRIAFPVESLPNPSFTEIPPPFSLKTPFFTVKSASSDPLQPKIGSYCSESD